MTDAERAERERLGLEELAKAGIGPGGDRGNWESYMSGRADLNEFAADTALRGRPTFSAGGIGGDADTNNDGIADAGWVRNPEPGGRAWMRANELPRTLASLIRPPQRSVSGGYGVTPEQAGLLALDAWRNRPGRITTMPVPNLSSLLRY